LHSPMQYTVKRPIGTKDISTEKFLDTLADDIIAEYEYRLLDRILKEKGERKQPYQKNAILSLLPSVQNHACFGATKRKEALKKDLTSYFSEHDSANVPGLVRFRLRRYLLLLEQTAEYLEEVYFSNREYDEFIALLKYFVFVQNGRPAMLHLVMEKNGSYLIYDEKRQNITKRCMKEWLSEENVPTENMDDLLISILITAAPERIVIHGVEDVQNQELLETIRNVFDKTEYCGGCNLCRNKEK